MIPEDGDGRDPDRRHNLHRLEQPADSSAPFAFAVVADIQTRFDELAEAVRDINADTAVRFVLVAGDLTQFGLLREFDWFDRELDKLNVPWMTVIGNHDALAFGAKIYRRRYGPLDYTFDYGDTRFVVANTNGWEFDRDVPDFAWLESELSQAQAEAKRTFVFSHVAPYMEQLDSAQSDTFADLMVQYGVKLSIHGHLHRYMEGFLYRPELRSVVVDNIHARNYSRITVLAGDEIEIERVFF